MLDKRTLNLKHHAVKTTMPATLTTLECSIMRFKILLAKAKCGSSSVHVNENGAVTNKKQVVCGFAIVPLLILGKHNKLVLSPPSQPSGETQ